MDMDSMVRDMRNRFWISLVFKMHQNLWWAVGYNVIAFPLAAGVFYPLLLSPEVAALAMSGSSALVAINALMLKRTRLEGIKRGDRHSS